MLYFILKFIYIGHSASVNSLDFHPSNGELLCSCDDNSEIRYWSVNQGTCKKVSKVSPMMNFIFEDFIV
jgi:WD40 repeat protein